MSWHPTSLAELAEVITKGTTPTTLGHEFTETGIPFLRVQNIEGGKVNFERDTLFIDERTHEALSRSRIRPGDVLVSIAGSIGRAGIVPIGAPALNCNQAVAIVRPKESVHRPFLRLWIESSGAQQQIRSSTVTGTISNLSLSQLGNLQIPLPPLAEQRRIAEVLDKAEALRAKRRAALAQLDSLTQSLFLDLFGEPVANRKCWPLRSFDETMRDETSRSKKLNQSEFSEVGKFPVIDQGQSTVAGYCDDDSMLCVSPLPVVVFGDHTKAVKFVSHPFIIGADGAKVLVPESGIETVFLAALLRMLPIPDLGYSRHMREVKRLKYIAPPLDLQREFARRVAAVEKLKTAQRAALAELDALFASLQHRAFRGEL